ncbi:MAG: FAD-dependent oxidoreductase [Polyangia bacterium]
MTAFVELFVPIDEIDEVRMESQPPPGASGQELARAPKRLSRLAEQALGWTPGSAVALRVCRQSLDARKGRPLGFRLRCQVSQDVADLASEGMGVRTPLVWPAGRPKPQVVVVGAGPTGSWAALRLTEAGVPVTILERGKAVQPRRVDLAQLTRGHLDPESNYCFGEGGAGTYSDGKLYTRSKDRTAVADVLADLVRFGAPPAIEVDARPHVGSNRLPKVLTALRSHLEEQGVNYRFGTEATSLRVEGGRVRAVALRGGDEIQADVVVLAVGHSARSVYEWAHHQGLALERKSFAVGVRIEHPQALIDDIQYGPAAGHPRLPPAYYDLTSRGAGRGVYSFCMCPGGWIVPAATEPDGVVVNGMSLSRRDSPYANSGFVVTVDTSDMGPDAAGPLAGIEFQRGIERAAFTRGGGAFRAPAQRLEDFLAGRTSPVVGASSYRPGLTPSTLDGIFPGFLLEALREGLRGVGQRMRRYLHPEALLVAAETRTSSPVRLLRDPVTLQSPGVSGLFPAGEGAGYAGGIVSAALDGVRIAESLVRGAS